ncbi:MAG: hypothetical protein HYZ28_10480 [Myxococcales bacterium]|nr:hypothetical protein [Myxococcales bacterium]
MRRVAKAAAVAGLVWALWPGSSLAQANGFKVGEGRVHPYFDLIQRFDSAAWYNRFSGATTAELITHFRPGLRLELQSPATNLQFGGHAEYLLYSGLLTPGSVGSSRPQAEFNLDAAFNKRGAVEFQVGSRYAFGDRSTNPMVNVGSQSHFFDAKAALPVHPGGGALEVTPSAAFTIEKFIDSSNQLNDYENVGFGLDGRWRFLPKTAVLLGATYDLRGATQLLRASGGLAGLVSPKVSTVLKAGYGHNFTGPGATVIGHVEVGYLMSETSTVKLGYVRTLNPLARTGVFGDDRVYLEGRALFGGRLALHGSGAFDWVTYYGNARTDQLVSLNLGPEYQFKPWLIGGLTYILTLRNAPSGGQGGSYARNEGLVRITVTY